MDLVFDFDSSQIRVIKIGEEPWFVAQDICCVLEIVDTSQAVASLDEDEKLTHVMYASGQNRSMWCINESGLYSFVLRSRKPQAKKFKKWITAVVLPSIRKTGSYALTPAPQLPQDYLSALKELVVKVEENQSLKSQIESNKPKVAFAEAIAFTDSCVSIGAYAKMIGTGRTRLFRLLRETKVIMKNSTLPYQAYVDSGYFEVSQEIINDKVIPFAQITGKGQLWLKQKLDSHQALQQRVISAIANGVANLC